MIFHSYVSLPEGTLVFCCKRKAMKGTSQLAKDKWVNPGLCMKDLEGNQSAEPTMCIQVGG